MFKIVKYFILTIILFSISLLFFGCDGLLDVNGNVSEWVNPPENSKSMLFINEQSEFNGTAIPIENAMIRIYRLDKPDADLVLVGETKSDSMGNFNDGWVVAPGKGSFVIRVEKEGYELVSKEFVNSNKMNIENSTTKRAWQHEVKAILVKN